MAKQETLNITGRIIESLSNAFFKVKLDTVDKIIIAQASGKIRLHKIRLVEGDMVDIEFSPYDLTKGRISRRL